MKGIILAGGSGTRLHPMTRVVSKQLLPVYDKPLVHYPLSALMLAGIRDILIISTPHDLPLFRRLLADGQGLGLKFTYAEQPRPEGLAQALIIAETFLAGAPSCLILGDNLFYGHGLPDLLREATQLTAGAQIFAYPVTDPERYGIVEFDAQMKAVSLEEKPTAPRSNYAVPGVYFFDGRAPTLARSLKPSARGELEITDLNKIYLKEGSLKVQVLGRGFAWLDTGTPESLLEAAEFVSILEKRQGFKVGCVEEIAFRRKFIDTAQLRQLRDAYGASDYGRYLERLLKEVPA